MWLEVCCLSFDKTGFGTSGRAESLRSLIEKIWGGQSGRYLAEARKLEHHYPHALKVKYNGS